MKSSANAGLHRLVLTTANVPFRAMPGHLCWALESGGQSQLTALLDPSAFAPGLDRHASSGMAQLPMWRVREPWVGTHSRWLAGKAAPEHLLGAKQAGSGWGVVVWKHVQGQEALAVPPWYTGLSAFGAVTSCVPPNNPVRQAGRLSRGLHPR